MLESQKAMVERDDGIVVIACESEISYRMKISIDDLATSIPFKTASFQGVEYIVPQTENDPLVVFRGPGNDLLGGILESSENDISSHDGSENRLSEYESRVSERHEDFEKENEENEEDRKNEEAIGDRREKYMEDWKKEIDSRRSETSAQELDVLRNPEYALQNGLPQDIIFPSNFFDLSSVEKRRLLNVYANAKTLKDLNLENGFDFNYLELKHHHTAFEDDTEYDTEYDQKDEKDMDDRDLLQTEDEFDPAKERYGYKDEVVGQRISILWKGENPPKWYDGVVKTCYYMPHCCFHEIVYDDGEKRMHDLNVDTLKWIDSYKPCEVVRGCTLPHKHSGICNVILLGKRNRTSCCYKEKDEIEGDDEPKIRKRAKQSLKKEGLNANEFAATVRQWPSIMVDRAKQISRMSDSDAADYLRSVTSQSGYSYVVMDTRQKKPYIAYIETRCKPRVLFRSSGMDTAYEAVLVVVSTFRKAALELDLHEANSTLFNPSTSLSELGKILMQLKEGCHP